jgi:Tfp pilus assembly protein PilO
MDQLLGELTKMGGAFAVVLCIFLLGCLTFWHFFIIPILRKAAEEKKLNEEIKQIAVTIKEGIAELKQEHKDMTQAQENVQKALRALEKKLEVTPELLQKDREIVNLIQELRAEVKDMKRNSELMETLNGVLRQHQPRVNQFGGQ